MSRDRKNRDVTGMTLIWPQTSREVQPRLESLPSDFLV